MATPPQDDFSASIATTGTVAVGGTATGKIDVRGEHDWFAVSLEAGKAYRVEVRGADTGDGTLRDPVLVGLYDATGTFVAGTRDDNRGEGRNSLTFFTPETAGTYYVAVEGFSYPWSDPGAIGTYTVAVAELEDDFSASIATTGTVAVGGTATGEITPTTGPRDLDWFAVSLEAGKSYRVEVRGWDTDDGTLTTPQLIGMYDASGTFIAGTRDDNGGVGFNALKIFTPATTGTYYVAAGAYASTGTYTVAVDELEDDYAASIRTAGTVAVGGTATGKIDGWWDHDWFAVSLEEGKLYRIEVRGSETGDGTLRDPVLAGMYNASGTFAGGGDDNGGAGYNSLTVFSPETSGTYHVATAGKSGLTGTYTVAVSEIAVPEDDFSASIATTGTVAVGGTATGEITPTTDSNARDQDWFAVSLEAGKLYRIEVRGSETGDGTLRDPVLVGMYDASGTFIAGTGDDDGARGSDNRLARNSLKLFMPETTDTHYVAVRTHGNKAGTYTVAVVELEDDFAASTGTTGTVAVDGMAVGKSDRDGDHDWFAVSLEAGNTYRIEVRGSETGDGTLRFPMLVGMYDASGTFIAGTGDDDGGEGIHSLELFTPTTTGTYYVAVKAFSFFWSDPGTIGTYTVAVQEVAEDDEGTAQDAPADSGDVFFQGVGETRGTTAADTLAGTAGADVIDGLAGNDTVRGLGGDDRLWGRQGADTLYGNAGSDRLWGGRDGDELHGGVGKDHLYGGLGHDTLYGGRGDDTLHGGRLADRLHGGEGKDVLVGGHGRDLFVYDDADFGRDRIVDFEDGLDRLDFTGSGLRWSDLSVSNNGKGDAVVRVDGANGKIVLEGVDASLIDQSDFIF